MVKSVYVPEAGGIIDFADDVTPEGIQTYVSRKYGVAPAAASPAPTSPDNSGLAARFAYGFGTGFTDIPGGIASLMYPAKEAEQTWGGQFSKGAREYMESGLGIDPTKDPTTAQMLAQGLGSAAGFLVPGTGVAKGAKLLGGGARLAGTAGAATVAAQGAALGTEQRAQQISQQLASGMQISEEQQLAAQRLSGLIGLSEAVPMHKFFGPLTTILSKVPASKSGIVEKIISSRLASLTKAGAEEAAQEAASGIANDLMEYGVYNPDVQIGQDILSNAGGGAFAGSVIEGVIQLAAGRKLRAARQLHSDLQKESAQNAADLRQGSIAQAAEMLRNSGVEGNVTVDQVETPIGMVYTLKDSGGKPLFDVESPDEAAQAVEMYKASTGANVNLQATEAPKLNPIQIGNRRFPTIEAADQARQNLRKQVGALESYRTDIARVSKEAAEKGFAPGVYAKQIDDSIKSARQSLAMFDNYFEATGPEPVPTETSGPKIVTPPKAEPPVAAPAEATVAPAPTEEAAPIVPEAPEEGITESFKADQAETTQGEQFQEYPPQEAIPEEMPIGSVEMPVEESRVLPDEIIDQETMPVDTTQEIKPIRTEQRPSATAEQLTDLKTELFGKAMNVREMTPEQLATYEAERDRRFPPEDVDIYYSAAPTGSAKSQTVRNAVETGAKVRELTPDAKKWMDEVQAKLIARLRGIIPADADIKFQTLIAAPQGYLARGRADAVGYDGMQTMINLSVGILKPGMSVQDAVNTLADTMNHEIIHAIRNKGVVRENEWRLLSKAAFNTKVPGKSYTYMDKAEAVYTPNGNPISEEYANPESVIEEAVADMYRDWVRSAQKPKQPVGGLLNRITEFFRRIFQTLRNTRHEEFFKAIESGEVGRRESDAGRPGQKFSAGPVYDPLSSNSDWETEGAPPAGMSSVNLTGGTPFRISQRRPTGRNLGASLANNLLVDSGVMKSTPEVFAHNVNILNSYPNMRVIPGEIPEQTLARFKEHVIENLLWLHDQMEPGLRSRAKNWYDGARAITDNLAKKYNLPDTTVAAVMAGLSPQKDWFQNVSLGERVLDIVMTKGDHKFDDKMMAKALSTPSMHKYLDAIQLMEGRTLNEINNMSFSEILARKHNAILAGVEDANKLRAVYDGVTAYGKAIFVRMYDETYNSRDYHIITPEGNKGALVKTGKGVTAKVAWGSNGETGKAISAILDGKKENIDAFLGDKHKIRNFYNNIISPMSTDGSVTIDTHAVAAALLRPLAGGSWEVHHNFGTSVKGMPLRTKNSAVTGLQGTYAFYADAYREAAARRGVLPREMQSITWEAVRGLYKPTYKAQAKNVDFINSIWEGYRNGEYDANEARNKILEHADPGAVSINNPFWKGTPGPSIYGGSGPALNTRGVGRLGVRQAAGRTDGGRTRGDARGTPKGGVKFSAAPALNTEEFKNWFKGSSVVNRDGSPKVMYHGTHVKPRFKAFDLGISEFGTHFGNARQANEFAMRMDDAAQVNGRVYPVYISMKRPLRLVDVGSWGNDKVAGQLADLGMIDRDLLDEAVNNYNGDEEIRDKLRKAIINAGYDGIVYLNRMEGLNKGSLSAIEDADIDPQELDDNKFRAWVPEAADSYIIFDNRQAKSVFNEFKEGEAKRQSFSAAPLPPYVEQQNSTLFAPREERSAKDSIFDFFFGQRPMAKTLNTIHGVQNISGLSMAGVAGKAAVTDKVAYINELEKLLNQKKTGNYQRMEADYSATAALTWRRRSSHIFASMMLNGNLALDYAKPGDIQSATMKVVDDSDSLKEIFKVITEKGPVDPATGKAKDKSDIFRSYAVARRAQWLQSTGQAVPREITPQYIRETMAFTQREYPEVIEAYNKYQRFNKKLLTTAKDAGIISQAELGRLTNQMNYYGFIYEVYGEPLGPTSSQKTASKFKLRPYTGSQTSGLVNDPLYVMMQNAQFWVDSIAKNLAATKSFELCRQMGEARLLGASEAPDELAGEAKDVMYFSQNGVVKRFAVKDPLIVTALGSDDRINVGKFWEMMGLPSQILRESVTRDPGFMVRNLMRDTISAWITSGANFVPVIDTVKGVRTALKNGTSFKALGARGVVGSYDLAMLGPKELAAKLRQNALPLNVHTVTTKEGAVAALGSLWNRLGHISEASDAATRIAVYDACKRQGLSDAEAAMQAIELLDFTRRGGSQTLGILTKLIPFLNARIQGMDVLYQAGKSGVRYGLGMARGEKEAQIGKQFLLRGGMLAILSVALEMLNQDDEDYQQLDDYIKNGNLLIPLKEFGLKGQFLQIPKPFEAGVLFSTIPQQIYKTSTGEASGRENAQLFWGQLASTFGVNPIPQAILPPIEIITNHNFYTGLPLISEGKARLAPELQYNTSTSQLAMMIGGLPIFYDFNTGKFGGMSPIQIDKLISGYGGPLGAYFSQAVGLAMQDASIGPERMPTEMSNLPVVKSFFVDAKNKNPKSVTQAYELFRIADEVNRTMSRLRQMHDAEALHDYIEENRDVLKYKPYIFKLADSLNKLSAQERAIERDTSMAPDEKFAAQESLRQIRIKLSSKVDEINKTLGR